MSQFYFLHTEIETVTDDGRAISSNVAIFLSNHIVSEEAYSLYNILFASIFTQIHMHLPVNEQENELLGAMMNYISQDMNNQQFGSGLLTDANYYREVNYRFVWNTTRTRCAMAVFSYKETVEVFTNKLCLRQ